MNVRDERGMSLIELIIAIMLVGVIIGPLFGAFLIALNTANGTEQRVSDSASAQLATGYFTTDAQSSDLVRTSAFTCGGPNTILEFESTHADPDVGTVSEVSYDIVADAGTPVSYAMRRRVYTYASSTCTLSRDTALVRNAVPATDADTTRRPSVTCSPTPCTTTPKTVAMKLTAYKAPKGSSTNYSAYTFTITGTRRVT